jgi:hypothetical protein
MHSTRLSLCERPQGCPIKAKFSRTKKGDARGIYYAEGCAMLKNKRAVLVIEVLVEPQPWLSTREGALKQRLPLDQRFAPHVGPVELDQIEGPHEHALVAVRSPHQFKTSDPVITARDGLTIDDAGSGAQPRQSFDDQGEARR